MTASINFTYRYSKLLSRGIHGNEDDLGSLDCRGHICGEEEIFVDLRLD